MKKKKSLIALIAVCFAGLGFGNAHADGDSSDSSNVSTWDGSSSSTDWHKEENIKTDSNNNKYYLLSTAADLKGFADLVNGGTNFSGETIKLGVDIDLNNINWTPISNKSSGTDFTGTFDGQGHTIKKMSVTGSSTSTRYGFFGDLKSKFTIKKLIFEECSISSSSSGILGVVVGQTGTATSEARFENITVRNSTVSGKKQVGSFAGLLQGGTVVNNCVAENNTVTATAASNTNAGGFAGKINGATIENCKLINSKLYLNNTLQTNLGTSSSCGLWASNSNSASTQFKNNRSDSFEALPTTINATNYIGGMAEFKVDNEDKLLDENLKNDNNTISYLTTKSNAKFEIVFGKEVQISNFKINDKDDTTNAKNGNKSTLTFGGDELTGTKNVITFDVYEKGTDTKLLSFSIVAGYVLMPNVVATVDDKSFEEAALAISDDGYYLFDDKNDNILKVCFAEPLDENAKAVITYNGKKVEITGSETAELGKIDGGSYTIEYSYNGTVIDTYTYKTKAAKSLGNGLYYVESEEYPWTKVSASESTIGCEYWQSVVNDKGVSGLDDGDESILTLYAYGFVGLQYDYTVSGSGNYDKDTGVWNASQSNFFDVMLNGVGSGKGNHYPSSNSKDLNSLVWQTEQLAFSDRGVNKVEFRYFNIIGVDGFDRTFLKNIKGLTSTFDFSEGGEVFSTVDSSSQNTTHVENGGTVEFEFGKSNSARVSVPYFGVGEACYVYVDGVKQENKLAQENDKYYYVISDLTKTTKLEFEYSAEGYLTERFVVTLDIVRNGDIKEDLIKAGAEYVTITNYNDNYPFKFNGALSESDKLVYSSSNQGVPSSKSGITFTFTKSGTLTFDCRISSECRKDAVYQKIGTATEQFIFNKKADSSGDIEWKTYSITVSLGDSGSETIKFYYQKDESGDKDYDCFAIANVFFSTGDATVKYSATGDGITATSEGKTFASGDMVTIGSKVSLSYANESYKFYGWKNVTTGKIVSLNPTYEFICTGDAEYVAVVGSKDAYVARSESEFYATLKEAAANTTSGTITLFGNHTLTEDVTIPQGVTLILPYSATDTTGYAIGGSKTRTSWFDGVNPYITLTINDGATLTINGKVIVGGVQHYADQSSQGHTSGEYSQIVNNGNISIKNGGYLNVVGRITGSGAISAESGATIRQPFLVNDYSGGYNTQDLYYAGQFPFTQFATINIECKQVVYHGAKVIGSTSLLALGSINTQDVVLIDSIEHKKDEGEGSLIWLESGCRLEITYDGNKKINQQVGNINLGDFGVTTIDVYGNITAGEFYLQGYGSGDKVLAVPYTYNINVKSGATVTVNQKYKIMPGAAVTIEAGGKINIGEKGAIYVYDGLIQAAKSGKEYPSADVLGQYNFAKSGMLIVNGTLKIDGAFAGIAQTTAESGVIEVGGSANVGTQTITDGCTRSATGYASNKTEFEMSGRVFGVNGFVNLETGKTYKTFATNEFILEKFTVTSAEEIAKEKWTVTLNQNMSGRFAEWNGEKFVVSLTFSVGGAEAGVGVTVNGTECQTGADGKFTCEVKVSSANEAITYFTTNVYTALQTHTLDLTQGGAQNLKKVASGVALDEKNNNYLRVLKADGSVETDFVLNAIVSYYGGTAYTVALTVGGELTADAYITTKVALKNDYIKTALAHDLTVVGADVAKFISEVESLASANDIVEKATELYSTFTTLTGKGTAEDIEFIKIYLSGKDDFAGKIVQEIKVGNAITYGDSTVAVTLVYVNGNAATDTATANLSGWKWKNSSVAATATYSGTYGEKTYAVTTGCTASKKAVTVKIDDKSSVYGEGIAELTAKAGELAYGDNYNDLGIALTKAGEKDVGTYDITGSWTNNFYNVTFENGKYTITAKPITVTIANQTSVYGDEFAALTATATKLADGEEYDILKVELTKEEGKNVGTYAITGTANNANYNVTFNNGTYEITARSVTVTVQKPSDLMEGKTNIVINATVTGAVNIDDYIGSLTYGIYSGETLIATVSGGTITVAEGQTVGVDTYTIKAINTDTNYKIESQTEATLNVVAKNNYYTVDFGGESKTYDGKTYDPKPTVKVTDTGAEVTDFTVTATLNNQSATILNAGTYEIKVTTADGVEYTHSYTVNKKDVTVTIDKKTSVYGDKFAELTATATGLAGGEEYDILKVELTKSEGKNVGTYTITGTASNGNYNVTFGGGEAAYTITAKTITVTIADKSSVYGDKFAELTATATKLADGEEYDVLNVKLTKSEEKNVGTYTITGTASNGNYDVKFIEGTYTISPKAVTVVIEKKEITYGQNAVVDNRKTLKDGDSLPYNEDFNALGITLNFSGNAPQNAGVYSVTGTASNNNYKVTFEGGENAYTIKAKDITVSIESLTSVYGETVKDFTATAEDFAYDDNYDSLGVTLSVKDGKTIKDVGTYEIIGAATTTNYNVKFTSATYTVTKKAITVLVNDAESVYGDNDSELTVTIKNGGTASGESVCSLLNVSRTAGANAGNYDITAETAGNENYDLTITYTNAGKSVYTIKKRPVTVTVEDLSVAYTITFAELETELKSSTKNAIEGDDLGLKLIVMIGTTALDENNFDAKFAGGAHIITATISNDNYELTLNEGTLTIGLPVITVNTDKLKLEFVYGETENPFNWREMLSGYLASASDATFKVVFYKADDTATEVELNGAGEYKMQIVIVHTSEYQFADGAKKSRFFDVTVSKKNITDSIGIGVDGLKNGGYVVFSYGLIADADVNGYNVKIRTTLTKNGEIVDEIDGTGNYEFGAEIDDDNYSGSKKISFRVIPSAAQKIAKLAEYASAAFLKDAQYVPAKDLIAGITADDMLQIDDDDKAKADYAKVVTLRDNYAKVETEMSAIKALLDDYNGGDGEKLLDAHDYIVALDSEKLGLVRLSEQGETYERLWKQASGDATEITSIANKVRDNVLFAVIALAGTALASAFVVLVKFFG